MPSMNRSSVLLGAAFAGLLAVWGASAQDTPFGGSRFNPPLPPPPPPPKIEVPVPPQMDAPPRYNYKPPPLPSFSERIRRCLDEGAALGLGPNERSAYSRACAN